MSVYPRDVDFISDLYVPRFDFDGDGSTKMVGHWTTSPSG